MADDILVQQFAPRGASSGEGSTLSPYDEDSREVAELIERASAHPLGIEFLRDGYLDAVAATFRAHAFLVEAARRRLR